MRERAARTRREPLGARNMVFNLHFSLLLSRKRDDGLYLESLLEFQWGVVARPRLAFMRTAEIVYTSGG